MLILKQNKFERNKIASKCNINYHDATILNEKYQ